MRIELSSAQRRQGLVGMRIGGYMDSVFAKEMRVGWGKEGGEGDRIENGEEAERFGGRRQT